jgi:hypothetical protein
MTDEDRHELGCLAVHILYNVPSFSCLTPVEAVQLGGICFRTYESCSRTIPEKLARMHYDVLIRFLIWTVTDISTTTITLGGSKPLKRAELMQISTGSQPTVYFSCSSELPAPPKFSFDNSLNAIIGHFVTLCNASHPLISAVIDSLELKKQGMPPEKLTLYIAVMCSVMHGCSPTATYGAFTSDWSIPFDPNFFPDDPFSMKETFLRDTINYCLEAIGRFVASGDASIRIYHFLPLLIQLLRESKELSFLSGLAKSSLLLILLRLAKSDLIMFDFVRMAVYCNAEECFSRLDCVEFFAESFFDEEKRASVVTCLACGFSPGGSETMTRSVQQNIVSGIVAIGKKCLSIKSDLVFELFPLIESSVASFSVRVSEFACESGLIDLISRMHRSSFNTFAAKPHDSELSRVRSNLVLFENGRSSQKKRTKSGTGQGPIGSRDGFQTCEGRNFGHPELQSD